jgi:hypothetical protein
MIYYTTYVNIFSWPGAWEFATILLMIDDVRPPATRQRVKPKVIQPLPKPDTPSVSELAAAHDAAEQAAQASAPTPDEPAFEPPEQIAAHEQPAAAALLKTGKDARLKDKPADASKPWYKISWPLSRKQQIIGGALVVLLAFGIGAGWTLTHHKRTAVAEKPKKSAHKTVAPPTIYSNLSGLPITDASLNQKPVTAVMVENSIDARPQSGLSQAGVVFEAVAEGGVTRFMALYQDTAPADVGPIRSARPYYVQWAMGFDAAYAHVGGSPDALSDIANWGVHDMNQFSNGSFYHRITSRDAPHNVYTGIDTLNKLESTKGYTSTFTGFTRKTEQPYKAPAQPSNGKKPLTNEPVVTPANSISMSLSGPTYDPHYDYDAASNSYKRSEAGTAQTDAGSNTQVTPKVVIAIVVPMGRGALDSSGAYYSDYNPIGTGTAYVFQDGTVTTGQWSKPSNSAGLTFTGSDGKSLALDRGQTWITAVTSTAGVTYK